MGRTKAHYGTDEGPLWDGRRPTMGRTKAHYGTDEGPLWDGRRPTMGRTKLHYGSDEGLVGILLHSGGPDLVHAT